MLLEKEHISVSDDQNYRRDLFMRDNSESNISSYSNSDDDRILKYVHKKFGGLQSRDSYSSQYLDMQHSIKKITIYNRSTGDQMKNNPEPSQFVRKSVIVKREDVKADIQLELQLRSE